MAATAKSSKTSTKSPARSAQDRAAAQLAAEREAALSRASALERELGNREYDLRALESRALLAERMAAASAAAALAGPVQIIAHQGPCEHCQALQAHLDSVHRSTSWRITRPLRAVIRLARRG